MKNCCSTDLYAGCVGGTGISSLQELFKPKYVLRLAIFSVPKSKQIGRMQPHIEHLKRLN